MSNVLIITEKIDPHADAVIKELQKLNCNYFRLNTEDLLNSYSISLGYNEEYKYFGFLKDKLTREINLNSLTSSYYRKPIPVKPNSQINNNLAKEFSRNEGENLLHFLYSYPNLKWVNHPNNNRQAQVKFGQLNTAKRIGLKIPRTLITNIPSEATAFFKELNNNVICKDLGTNHVRIEQESKHTYSHKLTLEEQENHIENIRITPTFFQEYIEKKIELRINVIGEMVFATEIDSQSCDFAKDDWRKIDPYLIPHKTYELPKNLQRLLVKYVKHYGLVFSAIDMIKTLNNEYVFLENNPNGQWLWIEKLTKQPIASSIAKILTCKM